MIIVMLSRSSASRCCLDLAAKTAELAAEIADGLLAWRAIAGMVFQEVGFKVLPGPRSKTAKLAAEIADGRFAKLAAEIADGRFA